MPLSVDGGSDDNELSCFETSSDDTGHETAGDSNTCRALIPSLHSQAVVKFALMDYVPRFCRPPVSTDLHAPLCASPTRPPSTDHADGGGGYSFSSHQHVAPEFVSFNIANMSLDSLDGVQVISDAKNIKKLLKLAYGRTGELSMTVHRVGGLLLLDEYDVTRHVLGGRQSQWRWLDRLLREFFFQTFEDTDWPRRIQTEQCHSSLALKSSRLFSQLLQHVLRDAAPPSLSRHSDSLLPLSPAVSSTSSLALPSTETTTTGQTHASSPSPAKYRRHYFSRNMLWTFQDLKMLIGTDMPILGGGTHPCVSLRLHDLSENINVLTGLDYWLDNLMSNVPEVLMCYHLNGVIKNFSLIRTDEFPQLRGSSFRPDVVHDVAENILSFLSDNATKTGHTYWLFKGEKDDFVKLYDLTSLLKSRYESFTMDDNPFTGHVAILLYRIACNMIMNRHSVDNGDRLGTLRTLLEKCLELMQGEKYLQVRANILLMLTECFVPRDHVPLSTHFVDSDHDQHAEPNSSDTISDPDADSRDVSPDVRKPETGIVLSVSSPAVDVKAAPRLSLDSLTTDSHTPDECSRRRHSVHVADLVDPAGDLRPTPVRGGALERATKALALVSDALLCERQWRRLADEGMREVRPFEAIPMPYFRLDESPPDDSAVVGHPPHNTAPASDTHGESGAVGYTGDSARRTSDGNDSVGDYSAQNTRNSNGSGGESPRNGNGNDSESSRKTPDGSGDYSARKTADGNGSDVNEPLLLQKAGQLCCVLASALYRQCSTDVSPCDDQRLHALRSAAVGLLAVRTAGRPDLVPEVTATSSILLADGLLALCRLPLVELVAIYLNWSDPAQLETLIRIVGTTRGLLEIPCAVENLFSERQRLLLLAEQMLRQCVGLQMCSSTRHQLRYRLGLVLNELGLVRKRGIDEYIDSTPNATNCGDVKDLFEAAERSFVECVSLLEAGVDRCMAEWNLAHLCDWWALTVCVPQCVKLHGSNNAPHSGCDTAHWLESASNHYSRCLSISHRCSTTAGAAARLARLLPTTAPPFHQLVQERWAAAAAVCCDHVTGVDQLRRLLSWCQLDGAEDAVRRRICGHTACVLQRLATATDRESRHVQERRCLQLRSHCVQLFQQAADMYCQAGQISMALDTLHEALIVRETDVQMVAHWKERVRCLRQSLLMVAGRDSPLTRIISESPNFADDANASEPASDVEQAAQRIVLALINTIKVTCILIRRNSPAQSKSALLSCFEDLYRLALGVTATPTSSTHRLAILVQHVQTAFDKT